MKRSRDYELSVAIPRDDYIATPRDSQRNWMLNRFLKEGADELEHFARTASSFVEGASETFSDRRQGALADEEIMEDWQMPVMQVMAQMAGIPNGDVLEVGFGRGVASDFIQQASPRSHTIVECNDSVVGRYETWKQDYPDREIQMLHGLWQDQTEHFGQYDGILFHTYPLDQDEFVEQVVHAVTFAENFFPVAARHLKSGGVFTYLTNESDSISRAHQRLIFEHFGSFSLQRMDGLDIPAQTHDAFWSDSIAIIQVTK